VDLLRGTTIDCRKIVILGDPAVGKTSIIQRYVHNQFKENYIATLGFNIYTRYITINNKKVGLSIWDVGGQKAFEKFSFRYLVESDAAIFIADVSRPTTIDHLEKWNKRLDKVINRKIPKIILFNKIDLEYDINTITDRVIDLKIRPLFNGAVFASAKTGQNVVDIFSMVAKMFLTWNEEFGYPNKRKMYIDSSVHSDHLPVLFFSSDYASNCKPVFKRLESLGETYPLSIRVIDVGKDKQFAVKYGVQSYPTAIIGTKTIVGDFTKEMLQTIIKDEYEKFSQDI
jgi:small GTP-binding protein